MGALMVQDMDIQAFSDCQAAITRFRHASNPLGSSVEQLQYGPLILRIRGLMQNSTGHELQWTKSHAERIKPRMDWTADDRGIYLVDLVAGDLALLNNKVEIKTYTADADEVLASIIPAGQWVWMADNRVFTGSLRHRAQCQQFQQYLNRRDVERIHQNAPFYPDGHIHHLLCFQHTTLSPPRCLDSAHSS
jgi:hypothetical protein